MRFRVWTSLIDSSFSRQYAEQGLHLIKMFTEAICADKPPSVRWSDRLSSFLSQAEPILGRLALVVSSKASETADVPSSFLEDLLALRKQVEQLNEEVCFCLVLSRIWSYELTHQNRKMHCPQR